MQLGVRSAGTGTTAFSSHERRNFGKMSTKQFGVFGSIIAVSPEPLFVPGGSAMQILVPWKPVVLVWGLLSAMIFFGFVASSVLDGKDPFAPGATITQPSAMKVVLRKRGNNLSTPTKRHRLRVSETSEISSC